MKIPANIQQAIQAYYAERATPDDVAALEDWFREDEAHVRIFAELGMVEWQVLCEMEKADAAAILMMLREAEENAEPDFSLLRTPAFDTPSPKIDEHPITLRELCSVASYVASKALHTKAAAYSSIAAMLLLGIALYLAIVGPFQTLDRQDFTHNTLDPNKPAESAPPILRDRSTTPVATLTATHNATWARPASAGPEHPPKTGTPLHPNQRLTLTAGFAEITTTRGAIAILQAPATIELLDHNAIHLHTGKLVGICETESSKGFVVKTDYADITDLGTEFGVRVNQEGVETSVFAGEVSVQATDAQAQHVTALQTARLEINADQHELTIENRLADSYTRRLPRPALVEAVQFGVDGLDANVAPQSLFAKALFYAERHYEPAIHTEAELPAELLGADIVQMPIHDFVQASEKFGDAVQVSLTVSQPAHVYVLVPPNARPGPWLQRDYKLTDLSLSYQTNNANGPDHVRRAFQIWQRRQPITGTSTVAGSLNHGGTGMYTMLVQPVDQHAHKSNPNPIH